MSIKLLSLVHRTDAKGRNRLALVPARVEASFPWSASAISICSSSYVDRHCNEVYELPTMQEIAGSNIRFIHRML